MKKYLFLFFTVFVLSSSAFASDKSQSKVLVAHFPNWGFSEMKDSAGNKINRGEKAHFVSISDVESRKGKKMDLVTPVICVVTKWPDMKSKGICWQKNQESSEELFPELIVMAMFADFPSVVSAKNGDVGSNIHELPDSFVASNSLTSPKYEDRTTCRVNEEGKAVDSNGDLIGDCEKTDAVISRIKERYKRW